MLACKLDFENASNTKLLPLQFHTFQIDILVLEKEFAKIAKHIHYKVRADYSYTCFCLCTKALKRRIIVWKKKVATSRKYSRPFPPPCNRFEILCLIRL